MLRPDVSVVIVTYERRADLELALESLANQRGVVVEAVVVDNASTDGTREWLGRWRRLPTIYHRLPRNVGASVGRNIGTRLARASLVAYMDSDAVALDVDLIARLREVLVSDPTLAATAPAIYEDAERRRMWFLAGHANKAGYHDIERSRSEVNDPEYVSTCFSLWRREVVLQLGGFDPAYPYIFEDLELCLRARDLGWRFRVLPEVGVHHRLSGDGRVRPHDSFSHRFYTERVMNRFFALRLGLWGFLGRCRWWLTPEGRFYRRVAYIDFPLSRAQRLLLFWALPVWTLLLYPVWRYAPSSPRYRLASHGAATLEPELTAGTVTQQGLGD